MDDNLAAPPPNEAVSWRQQWYDGLEEASTLWFLPLDAQGMMDVLTPLHEMIDLPARNAEQTSFRASVGDDLAKARHHTNRYLVEQDLMQMQEAWDLYYSVFQRISKEIRPAAPVQQEA